MKNKALLKICEDLFEDCNELFGRFNDSEFETSGGTVVNAFKNSCYYAGEGEDFLKKYGRSEGPNAPEDDDDMFDDLFNFSSNVAALAFSFGYAMGQMVDPTDPADRNRIKKIQRVIREEHLLPYVPREKKERRMP